jgi:L-ribulose-5-phosphate 3-epimerase
MKMGTTRREFIKKTALTASLLPLMHSPLKAWTSVTNEEELSVHIFSKHLQFLDYKTAGQIAAELGFSGVDLTVRPKGHVLPENVKTDLPVAIKAIQEAGSACELITTTIGDVNNPVDVDVVKTAAQEGVKYYRPDWYDYTEDQSMPDQLIKFQKQIAGLSELNKELGIIGCYQNHASTSVGASVWEVYKILETANQDYFGSQYDIRHAVVEGGVSWPNGVRLLRPQIKTIVLKDFIWGKENGAWVPINTPIGEGMVNFDSYFKLLKKYGLKPPVSLHLEYPLGGAEKGSYEINIDKKIVFDTMKKDLITIQKLWKEA